MRRFLPALACGGFSIVAAHVSAATPPVETANLILEIWVNGVNTNVVADLVNRGGQWWAERSDLADAGINVTKGEFAGRALVPLANLDGVAVDIDKADQRLLVDARPDCLVLQRIDLRSPSPVAAASSTTGVLVNYGVSGTVGDVNHAAKSSGLATEAGATVFSPLGTVTATGFSQVLDGGSQFVRLDTTAEWDEPALLRRWLLGDAISGGLSWSRSVRFGGIQLATDFTLQPGLAIYPLPAFFGQTAVPGSVDVFVNASHVFEGNVSPGPFEINDLPAVTGSGDATVVVRNVLGQEVTQSFSFYTSDALLQKGLSSYDFDIGFLRELYGEQSFDYHQPLATGTWRYGISDWFTAETHGEAAPGLELLGAGGAFTVGAWGVVGADIAASNARSGNGALYSATFQSQSQPFGVFGSISATEGHYLDLASIGGTPPSRLRTQLGGDLSMGQFGSLATSWIGLKDDGSNATQLLSATYSLSFRQGWYLSATGLHDCGSGTWAAELSLSLPIGNGLVGSASAQAGANANGIESGVMRPTDPDGGLGYSVSASVGDIRSENGEATWNGDHGTLDAAVSSVNGQTAARLSVSGAFVEMNGTTFATRAPDGAIALVETGNASVPVYLENRQVAVSDGDGEALLTNLAADAPNRIGIQPTDYSFATVVTTTQQTVVPRRQAGVIVDLAPPRSRPALVSLRFDDGTTLPPGGEVTLSTGGATLLVGHGGQIFISDLETTMSGTVRYPERSCRFSVTALDHVSEDVIPKLGPVLCGGEKTE